MLNAPRALAQLAFALLLLGASGCARVATGEVGSQGALRGEVVVRSARGSAREERTAALAARFRANLERGLRAAEEASRPPD